MQKLIIFGDLTSGYGGMETAIRAFYRLMSARYHVELIYIRAKNPQNNYDWLQGLTHTFPTSLFSARWLELNKAKRLLRQQINREAVAAVICYDRKSILLAQEVMKTSRNRVPIYSWAHMSLASLREDDGLAMAGTDYQLAICDEIAAQLEQLGAKSERVFTIYNPIVRQSFTFARPEIDEPAQFLYLGRLTYQGQKNLQELLHGVAKLSFPYVLHMVGKGRDETDEVQLRALAESLGIAENIRWHGWQAQAWQYVREQIPKLSAIVLSSRAEGMPMVLAEAMSYGVACVSSDCPTGPKSLIQEGENGWLYPCGEVDALSEKLRCAAQTALSPEKIKASVENFYEETYQKNLLQIFAQFGAVKS